MAYGFVLNAGAGSERHHVLKNFRYIILVGPHKRYAVLVSYSTIYGHMDLFTDPNTDKVGDSQEENRHSERDGGNENDGRIIFGS